MSIARQIIRVEPKAAPAPARATLPKPTAAAKGAKRGPKPSGNAKKLITLRLDPDVIDGFKSSGEGWQARINAILRKALNI